MSRRLAKLRNWAWRRRIGLSFLIFFAGLASVVVIALEFDPFQGFTRKQRKERLVALVEAQGGNAKNWNNNRRFWDLSGNRFEVVIQNPEFRDADLQKLVDEAGNEISVLELSSAHLTDAGLDCLAGLRRLETLKIGLTPTTWNPTSSTPDSLTGKALAPISKIKNLKYLVIHDMGVTDNDLNLLDRSAHLELLMLIRAQVHGSGLARMKILPKITSLNFMDTPFDDEGIKSLEKASKLEFLALSWTKVTAAGLAQLSSRKFPRLKRLELRGLPLREEDFQSLGELDELTHLWLFEMNIDGSGLIYAPALKNLFVLYLNGTNATDETVANLRLFLPRTHINRQP